MNDSRFKITIPHCSLCVVPYDMYYHVPLVIPKCGHSFCQKCIQGKIQIKSNKRTFTCPQCHLDIIIRKSISEELPRNISIIDVVKTMKKTQAEEELIPQNQCIQHQKPLQVICLTCRNRKICSHCAIFGDHKGHEISNKMPITKTQLQDLNEYYQIISQAIKSMILPTSPQNILEKSKINLSQNLKKMIKLTFQHYYDQIAKRQAQLLKECDQIQVIGDISNNIDNILADFDLFKMKYESCSLNSDSKVIDQLFEKGKNIHLQIERLSQQVQKRTSEFLNQAGKEISQAIFFRINQISLTLKSMLEKEPIKQKKTLYIENEKHAQNRHDAPIHEEYSKSVKKPQKKVEDSKYMNKKSISQRNDQTRSKFLSTGMKNQSRSKMKSKDSRAQLQYRFEGNDLKYIKPLKQITYELRPKFQSIVNEIERQEVGGSLELINSSINDQLMVYICEHIRRKELKYSMMKLVKNGINDEGMRILLSYLVNDNYTKVLNLTGNQLTQKSLDLLTIFVQRNHILKTIYLSNNKISAFQLKARRGVFDEHSVEINL